MTLHDQGINRRKFIRIAGAIGAGAIIPAFARDLVAATMPQQLVRFPEKTDLILLTDRPPQLETPLKYFTTDITPNDAFFVRWHLAGIPTRVDLRTFRLSIGGHVDRPLSLSMDDLRRQFEPISLVAVAQCSGNSRSFFDPRVPGGQWANGAMGNAKWTGVRLRDLLQRAAVRAGAVDVSFGGMDRSALPGVAPFVKSLDVTHATDGEVMVAYAMNDADLPMLNGFPLRLVVPGWFATYWVKSLNEINVLPQKFSGFWMDKAYRIPANREATESAQKLASETIPINRHLVRSIFVRPEPGARILVGREYVMQGIALDDGDGIRRVEVSTDAGSTWADARLGDDLGRYSWRIWRFNWTPTTLGKYELQVRATSDSGATQPTQATWNRSGYQRNVIEQLNVNVM